MMIFNEPTVVMSKAEYEKLTDPDKTYSLMTKTLARAVVKRILVDIEEVCWNDDVNENDDNGSCASCGIMEVLGRAAGERMCDRPKRWSK